MGWDPKKATPGYKTSSSEESFKQQPKPNVNSLSNISMQKIHGLLKSGSHPIVKLGVERQALPELFFLLLKEIGNYRNIIKKKTTIFKTYLL